MAFVTVDLAESVTLSGETVSDGTKSTEGNLNDGNTGTSASAELRQGMAGYKITHDLGFAVANLDSISIRFFDGVIMTAGDIVLYPYSSGDSDVVTGNEVQVTVVDDGAYQAHDISAMIGDFGDVGTDQISIRLVAADSGAFRGRFNEIEIEFAEGGGGQNIAVAQVTETDTAQPFTVATGGVNVPFGQVTETDTAQAFVIAAAIAIAFGQVTETDTAQPFTVDPGNTNIVISQVVETDTAQPFTVASGGVNVAFGQVVETDTAQPFTISQGTVVPVAQVTETDTAQPFTVDSAIAIAFGQVVETDTAQPFTVAPGNVDIAFGQVTETDTAQPFAVSQAEVIAVAQVVETDTAQPFTIAPGNTDIALAQVTETDTAQPFTVAPGNINVSFSQVTETDTAQPFTVFQGNVVVFGQALETDTAQPFAVIGGGGPGPVVADKMADPRTPGRDVTRKPRKKQHPAWREMEERLKREYADANKPPPVQVVEVEQPENYLQALNDQHDQVADDIAAIEARLEVLQDGQAADAAERENIEQDIETARVYLARAIEREKRQLQMIAAIEAVIRYYYF